MARSPVKASQESDATQPSEGEHDFDDDTLRGDKNTPLA